MLSPALALELELVVPEQPGLDFRFIKQDGQKALAPQPAEAGFKSRQQVIGRDPFSVTLDVHTIFLKSGMTCQPFHPMLPHSQRELARASIMMSAVPCIATLMTLREVSLPQHDGKDAPRATGRILLQNKLSLAYWGKLTVKNETGEAIYIF